MKRFAEFCDAFGWRAVLDAQYFNHQLDWSAAEVPAWWTFDPPECQVRWRF